MLITNSSPATISKKQAPSFGEVKINYGSLENLNSLIREEKGYESDNQIKSAFKKAASEKSEELNELKDNGAITEIGVDDTCKSFAVKTSVINIKGKKIPVYSRALCTQTPEAAINMAIKKDKQYS